MQERRSEPRQRVLKVGKIVHNGQNSLYDCRISDLSDGGARLAIEQAWLVPKYFRFIDQLRGKEQRPAHVVWRGTSQVGIAFDDASAHRD